MIFHSYVKLPEGKFQGRSPEHMAKHMVRLRTSINWILEISHWSNGWRDFHLDLLLNPPKMGTSGCLFNVKYIFFGPKIPWGRVSWCFCRYILMSILVGRCWVHECCITSTFLGGFALLVYIVLFYTWGTILTRSFVVCFNDHGDFSLPFSIATSSSFIAQNCGSHHRMQGRSI